LAYRQHAQPREQAIQQHIVQQLGIAQLEETFIQFSLYRNRDVFAIALRS
jgi:hypothetical protein